MPKNLPALSPESDPLKNLYLKPEIIARVERLGYSRRGIFEGNISGKYHSPFRGYSSDFHAFRPYTQGDDLRYLDWKVYGRTEKFFIKQFEEETNMRVIIALDCSASMNFPKEFEKNKLYWAKTLASTLAYILIKRGDSVGFLSFSERLISFIPDARGSKYLTKILSEIAKVESSGKTKIFNSLNDIGPFLKRRTLIILISDLLSDFLPVSKVIRSFLKQKHRFVVLQVLSSLEFSLPQGEAFVFVDMETQERVRIDVEKVRTYYKKEFEKFNHGIEGNLKSSGVGFFRFNTHKPMIREIPLGLIKAGFTFR